MFNFLQWVNPKPKPAKYRMKPIQYGRYSLEKYNYVLDIWLSKGVVNTKDEGEALIKHLEGKVFYYHEDKT